MKKAFLIIALGFITAIATGNGIAFVVLTTLAAAPFACRWMVRKARKSENKTFKAIVKALTEE